MRRLVLYFINDVEVDLAIESSVEGIMERIPQAVEGETRLSIMGNGFDGREFSSFNPVYQLPGTVTLIRNFLDFVIEEESLDVFDNLLEFLPILETS